MSTPLFMTRHAPIGAWASLTFGDPNRGVAIEQESLGEPINAALILSVARGDTSTLAFSNKPQPNAVSASAITRTLTPCIDEFSLAASGIALRIYTPHAALPNPKRSGNLQYATAPGLLMELSIDNSTSDLPATASLTIDTSPDPSALLPLRRLDGTSKILCGVGYASRWILAANQIKNEVATESANSQSGGITFTVPPRTQKTFPIAFAFFQPGFATQGIDGRYFYTTYFPRIEAVANFLLQNAARIRESCASFDARTASACPNADVLSLFSGASRAYESRTQIVDSSTPAGPSSHFAFISRKSARRNPLDQIVDHLPWELQRNPWVIRNTFDLATSSYAYHDKVRFPLDADSPDELRDGGMLFSRDFGVGTAYAPATASGTSSSFDGASLITTPRQGGKLATEILLNAIYMLTSYALMADDTPWAKTRLPFARELLVSLENRDHWDPEKRTGILKAQSASAGKPEETLFACPSSPPELVPASGSLYIAVKTFCANLLLTTYFQNNNDLHSADYSYAFAQKTAASIVAAFNTATQALPANLLTPHSAITATCFEPLALPTYLGLTSTLAEYFPELHRVLAAHAAAALKPAPRGCVDPATLTLRLSSTSSYIKSGKLISILYVLERLFQVDAAQLAPTWTALAQEPPTSECITAALFIKPPQAAPAPQA